MIKPLREELSANIGSELISEPDVADPRREAADEIERLRVERAKLRTALRLLLQFCRSVAEPVGPLHGWWDGIADADAALGGRAMVADWRGEME